MNPYCVRSSSGNFVNVSLENKLYKTPPSDFGGVWTRPETAQLVAEEAARFWEGETFIAMPVKMLIQEK